MHDARDWTDEQVIALVGEHERLVRAYLKSMGCPAERVEDLAQEAFLRLFSRPRPPAEASGLRGYLCRTARNLFLNSLRDDSAAPDLEQVDQAWSEFEGAETGSHYLDALEECLQHLPGRAREVLRMRYASDMPRAAIATRMRMSLGGVKALILRSKQTLRGCIQRKLGLAPVDPAEATQ